MPLMRLVVETWLLALSAAAAAARPTGDAYVMSCHVMKLSSVSLVWVLELEVTNCGYLGRTRW